MSMNAADALAAADARMHALERRMMYVEADLNAARERDAKAAARVASLERAVLMRAGDAGAARGGARGAGGADEDML